VKKEEIKGTGREGSLSKRKGSDGKKRGGFFAFILWLLFCLVLLFLLSLFVKLGWIEVD
jgi:hypothetical protein